MQNLNFNDGQITIMINGDESRVITINPTDKNMVNRFISAYKDLSSLEEKYRNVESDTMSAQEIESLTEMGTDASVEAIGKLEKISQTEAEIEHEGRAMVDKICGSPVSEIVFGDTNCMSIAGGQTIAQNFIDAYAAFLEPYIKNEYEKAKNKIGKYTRNIK